MQADNCEHEPNRWSHAGHWADHAQDLGYEVNDMPAPGSIAQWGYDEIGGGYGHVAYVEAVNDDGTVDVSEYNFAARCGYGTRNKVRAPRYIHVLSVPLRIAAIDGIESGKIRIIDETASLGETKGTVVVGGQFKQQMMSAAFNPTIIEWASNEIELDLFTSGFDWDEFGWPIEMMIFKANGESAGTIYYPFKDVRDYDWYSEYTTALWKDGVIHGEKNGSTGYFLPGEEITRAEFIKMAVVASGQECSFQNCSLEPPSGYISKDHWAYEYMKAAYNAGWLDISKPEFLPDEKINRAESAKILDAAMGKDNERYTGTPIFEDVSSNSQWFYDDVHICTVAGIFQGYTPGMKCDGSDASNSDERYFCPAKKLNRAEASKVICKTFLSDLPAFLYGVSYEQFLPDRTIAAPSIVLRGNSEIRCDQECYLTAIADYCSDCNPSYGWSVNSGDVETSQDQTSATWFPPNVSKDTQFTISVTLSDGKGHKEQAYHKVMVKPNASPCISVSGRIADGSGNPIDGVRMGGLPTLTWTDSNGEYSVCVEEGWSGTATPFNPGFSFTPVSATLNNVATNETRDFTANGKQFVISGRVLFNNEGLGGVAMNGLPGSPVTDENGFYEINVPFHWSGAVSPQKDGYTFSPSPRTYNEVGRGHFSEDYTAFLKRCTISGTVFYKGVGLEGVVLNGLPGGIVTNSQGDYSAEVKHGWSGTVAPFKQSYEFIAKDYSDVASDEIDQNYDAVKSAEIAKVRIVTDSQELQSACALAREGDIVLVKPGNYENVQFGIDSNVRLISEGGPSQTFLELSHAIEFDNQCSNAILDGFSIEYPSASDSSDMIRVAGDSNIQIKNCRIILPESGHGIEIRQSGDVLIEGCVFENPYGNRYSSINLRSGTSGKTGDIIIRNNHFKGTYSGVVGNGDSLNVFIENNIFKENEIGIEDMPEVNSLKIWNNIFDGNEVGAELDYGSPHSIEFANNTFINNSIGVDTNGSATFFNNIFQNNSPGITGGGKATITIHHHLDWQSSSFNGFASYNRDEDTIWEKDPLFVSASSGNYHLTSRSPAKGAGVDGADLGAFGGIKGDAWKTPLTIPRDIPEMRGIEIKGPGQVNLGHPVQLYAIAVFDGYEGKINHVADWDSSDASVLASEGNGSFLTVDSGTANAGASYAGMKGEYNVTVLDSDITISLEDNLDPASVGGEFQYIVGYQNEGYGNASGVRVSFKYDPNVIFLSSEPESDAGTINSWTIGDLTGGQNGTIRIHVRAAGTLSEGDRMISSVAIQSDYNDPVQIAEETKAAGLSSLRLSVESAPGTAQPGEQLSYHISYENTGNGTVRHVLLVENYDARTSYVAATPLPDDGVNRWIIGDLSPGEKGTILVTMAVNDDSGDGSVLKNEATISADGVLPVTYATLTPLETSSGLKGDLDNNGEVTAQDAKDAFLLSFNTSWSAEELAAADINGDGAVTAQDAKDIFELSFAH